MQPGNLANAVNRGAPDLADPLRQDVDGLQNRGGLLVKEQVIVAEVWTRQVPVEVLRLDVEGDRVSDQGVDRLGDGPHIIWLQIRRRGQLSRHRRRRRSRLALRVY